MPFIQPQLPLRAFLAEEVHDDMIPEALLLAGVSLAATYLAAGGQTDLICIPGAMLGAVVALLKATQERRQWTDKGIIIIGSSVIGTTLPSGVVNIVFPDWVNKLTWHVYFLAGFIFSIVGWMLIWPIIMLLDARRDKIAKAAVRAAAARVGLQDYSDSPPENRPLS
jgi:hypothetical protein